MQKWEYALVKFEKGASKVALITHGYIVELFEYDPSNILREFLQEGFKNKGVRYTPHANELIVVDLLSKLGQSGWEVVEVLANDQMFLKRPIE